MRVMADDDMIEETNQPQDIRDSPEDDFDDESDDSEEDFESLNLQLDQLNSALDELEQKNDDIHAQLILLLQSNREARQQIQDSLKNQKIKQHGVPGQTPKQQSSLKYLYQNVIEG